MKKTAVGLMGCLVVAGCSQTPAPVVSGYESQSQKPMLTRMADSEAPRLLEPEANPRTIGGIPVMEVSKVEDLEPPASRFNVEPAAGPAPQPVQTKIEPQSLPAQAPKVVEHTVSGTDSVYKIASQYNTTARKVMESNNLKSPTDIQVGQVLKIETGAKQPTAWEEMQAMLAGEGPAAPASQPRVVAEASKPLATEVTPAVAETVTPVAAPEDQPQWVMHKVEAKETIYRISRAYNVSVLDIMAANDFEKPQDLKFGTQVKVPVAASAHQLAAKPDSQLAKVEPAAGDGRENDRRLAMLDTKDLQKSRLGEEVVATVAPVKAASTGLDLSQMELKRGHVDMTANRAKGMVWPVKGEVVRKFGDGGSGVAYTGVNIAVPNGTPVLASDGGTVLYADDGLKIYGKLVLIRHESGMVSAYAHNGHLLVNKGERVKKGQVVAMSGATGNVEQPQLHFELRQHANAIDPMRVLPKL